MPSIAKTSTPRIPWESMRWKLPVVKVLLPEWSTICHIPNLKEENKYTVILLIFKYRKYKGKRSLQISVLTAWVTACKRNCYCYGDRDFLYRIVNLCKYLHQQIIKRYCISPTLGIGWPVFQSHLLSSVFPFRLASFIKGRSWPWQEGWIVQWFLPWRSNVKIMWITVLRIKFRTS